MIAALCVGAGGFCGAIARYLLGLLPYQGQFPLITFVINFTGAVAIGAVVEAASIRPGMLPPNAVLFVKTGLCGASPRSAPSRWKRSGCSSAANTP